MIWAQHKGGQKLHLACEPGEEYKGVVIRKGSLSQPICGKKVDQYRMTINLPLGNVCKNCLRVFRKRRSG